MLSKDVLLARPEPLNFRPMRLQGNLQCMPMGRHMVLLGKSLTNLAHSLRELRHRLICGRVGGCAKVEHDKLAQNVIGRGWLTHVVKQIELRDAQMAVSSVVAGCMGHQLSCATT